MHVTVKALLNLPSLSHSKVVAGAGGLDKIVDSISVLEYSEPTALQEELFDNNEFYGSEIVITGFIHIKDDIEAQCRAISRLHEVGEVGLILYYVGIFMPAIDQKLIDLANELDFTLICMPENRMDLRYSEVIYEVVEAIVKNKTHDPYFVSEMLDRISKLPDHQRSMDTVLRMVSDRMNTSLYLVDDRFASVNLANWPLMSTVTLACISDYFHARCSDLPTCPTAIEIGRKTCVCAKTIQSENASPLYLIMVKEDGMLSEERCDQATEVVQLFINIWSKGHGRIGIDELIKAILNDEPMKMRRLAEILNIDIQAIHHLIFIKSKYEDLESGQGQVLYDKWALIAADVIKLYFNVFFTGVYRDTFIIFLGGEKAKHACQTVKTALAESLSECAPDSSLLITAYGQANTTEVRKAFLLCTTYLPSARLIFPLKAIVTQPELQFAKHCHEIITGGEKSIRKATGILAPLLQNDDVNDALCDTLTTYLLDADSNVAMAADCLYVHKNTIKYRLQRIGDKLNFNVNKMPEHYTLYEAVAIKRLLGAQNQQNSAQTL